MDSDAARTGAPGVPRGYPLNWAEVTRFEVIDHTHGLSPVTVGPAGGPRFVIARDVHVELSVQDDGHTLKVFLTPAFPFAHNTPPSGR